MSRARHGIMPEETDPADIGARVVPGGVSFRVWAPRVRRLAVRILAGKGRRTVELHEGRDGYFSGIADQARAGDRYLYFLDGAVERPDPASRFQPEGVHGPSLVTDLSDFSWRDAGWRNPPLRDYVIYELHVGTFTREGTFGAAIAMLSYLRDLGVTAVELMPVAQFPGERNWGYDGVYPFAPQNSYGGTHGLMEFVDACHAKGLAVILDVVYNHLGPEGNYLRDFGFYFTGHYRTPWGDAVNFDGPYSDQVRSYFIGNALHWIRDYHVDALRLDAVHSIYDFGAHHFLQELASAVRREGERLGRRVYVIAESDLNDVRLIAPTAEGGYGLDSQWCDDYHHSLHALLTGERDGYYLDFGASDHLVRSMRDKHVYSGEYSAYRRRRHGNSAASRPDEQFVVFSQNHDQVGNRMLGERLSRLVSFESLKLAAGLVLLSPYLPLLFMGEEYGEENPFLYFVNHQDPDLVAAVRAGRKEEFKDFTFRGEPPDPEAAATFEACKLDWDKRETGRNRMIFELYRRLIRLRRALPALQAGPKTRREVGDADGSIVWITRGLEHSHVACLFNVGEYTQEFLVPVEGGVWWKLLDSAEETWGGPGSRLPERLGPADKTVMSGRSFAVYEKAPRDTAALA